MTNREWLATLSDEDFIKWLFEGDNVVECNEDELTYEQPFPRLEHFKRNYTSTTTALKDWLKQERK